MPYITTWSAEEPIPTTVVNRVSGIGYADETLADRDQNGVLWQRMPSRPGAGRPLFGKVHSLRQRRAMRRLLCGICGGPPDRDGAGTLWLVRDFRDDWSDWPEGMAATEPPICRPCAELSIRICPALHKGYVAMRVGRSTVAGVYGLLYHAGRAIDHHQIPFDDPLIPWTCAAQLLRELRDCTIVELNP